MDLFNRRWLDIIQVLLFTMLLPRRVLSGAARVENPGDVLHSKLLPDMSYF
jgi:hypothetical protein